MSDTQKSSGLRVVSLQAQNILRLTAIDIKWDKDQSVLTLGGKNGAGKSSAVNCVAMALGGKELCPAEPIKRGEAQGFVELDLGELRIRRDFWREELPCNCGASEAAKEIKDPGVSVVHEQNCVMGTYGETRSRLVVRNADNITQGTPQAILDKLIGKMTFDPMAFVNMESKPQEEILRRIVNLDVSAHECTRVDAFNRRAQLTRSYKDAVAVLESLPTYDDVPATEISFDEVTRELQRAEELRKVANDAEAAILRARDTLATTMRHRDSYEEAIVRTQTELQRLTTARDAHLIEAEKNQASIVALTAAANDAQTAVPNVQEVNQKLKDIEATNVRIRSNARYVDAADAAKILASGVEEQDAIIKSALDAKRAALEAAPFPVPGLSLSDSGVTFNDLPFKQASTAEQIRVSVAIGFALHPKLKLLLVKNGNALDDDSLQLVAKEAAAAGGQILMEYVTKDAADVSVFIEDGHQA